MSSAERHLPSFDLTGRTVLVTGAGRGLGQGMALGIAEAGATVVAVSRTPAELAATVAAAPAGRVHAVTWDVADLATLDDLVARAAQVAGPIFGCVLAAGAQHRARADAFTPAARLATSLRAHWLRMPAHRLIPHALHHVFIRSRLGHKAPKVA